MSSATGDSPKTALGLSRAGQYSRRSEKALNASDSGVAGATVWSQGGHTARIRVEISARNELIRKMVSRGLRNVQGLEVVDVHFDTSDQGASFSSDRVDVLVLISSETLQADLDAIHAIRAHNPGLRILFLGTAKDDGEFLQYVRAGISGFLRREATVEEIARGIENVHAGKAVCPGELCAALFRFFEDAEPRLPFASPTQRLGLTRREQQIVPLIAKGFTNKEIANHFCLSEQTVKNHLYRMKHKIGAEDRLSIVQKFRVRGLLL